jgi:hypothetical protein
MSSDGSAGKREGMDRAERHADPHWWAAMLESGKEVALRKPFFFTDDIVKYCSEHHPNATTHEHRAIGPLMRELARMEVCEPTQDWVPSSQKQNHKRPMQVWWSLIYRGSVAPRKPRRYKSLDPRQLKLDI